MDLLVVSGLSGGGKSTALRALEDVGVYCVDNLPVPLVNDLADVVRKAYPDRPIAVGVDARDEHYLTQFQSVHDRLVQGGHEVEVLFVEAANSVITRRFSQTRRAHPMGTLPAAIDRERELLEPVRSLAKTVLDTTDLTARQLHQIVRDRFGPRDRPHLSLVSFSFRRGLPPEADLVLDARFLSNPHDKDELRPLSGLHEPVAKFVLDQPDAETLLAQAETLVRFMVPRTATEGRAYLTLGIGCTGGQHRSVALIEALKARLERGPDEGKPPRLVVRHRDIGGSK